MKKGRYQSEQNKWSLWIILFLIIVTILSVAITIWALFFRDQIKLLAPDYAPIETEENAQMIFGDKEKKMELQENGGSVGLTYSDRVTIHLATEAVQLNFANPSRSNQDMVVQIVVQDVVLVQTGRLQPGYKITTMELLPNIAEKLSAGIYEGHFTVSYYDEISGEKAMVNTEIPVTITVE